MKMMRSGKKKVIKHLKGDIKTFKKESNDDKELINEIEGGDKAVAKKKMKKGSAKVKRVMHEFKEQELHSGSKKGPVVKNKSQAVAIALSEQRKVDKKKKKS